MKRAPRLLLGLWVGLVLAGAAGLVVHLGLPPLSRELFFWLGACLAGELLWVRLAAGAATISMASCFNFAALLVLPTREAMLVAGVATLAAELAVMRKHPIRAGFNAAQTLIAVALGSLWFESLGGRSASLIELVSRLHVVPILAAAFVYYAVNRGTVVLAVALCESIGLRDAWRRNFGSTYDVLSCAGTLSLGALLATQYATLGMVGTLFIALPLLLACDGYRRFTRDANPPAKDVQPEREAA